MIPRSSRRFFAHIILAFAFTFGVASAITIDANRLLGVVTPGSPADAENQLNYINTMVDRYNSLLGDGVVGGYTYDLSPGSAVPAPILPLAGSVGGNINVNATSTDLDVTGITWILAKVGDAAAVYYVADLSGIHTLQNNSISNGQGNFQEISHYTLGTGPSGGPSVPDGDPATIVLASGMLALVLYRSRARKS